MRGTLLSVCCCELSSVDAARHTGLTVDLHITGAMLHLARACDSLSWHNGRPSLIASVKHHCVHVCVCVCDHMVYCR